MHTYVYIYIHIDIYIYIYTYNVYLSPSLSLSIYIYIYIWPGRADLRGSRTVDLLMLNGVCCGLFGCYSVSVCSFALVFPQPFWGADLRA